MEKPFKQNQEIFINCCTQWLLVVMILMFLYESILLCRLIVYLRVNNLEIHIEFLPAIEP